MHDGGKNEQSDADLGEASELTHALMNSFPGGVLRVSAQGLVIDANQQAHELLGVPLGQMPGTQLSALVPLLGNGDGEAAWPESLVARTIAEKAPIGPMDRAIRRPDGATTWLVVRAVPFVGARGEVREVLVSFVDVSERRRAVDALRASEETLRSIVESAPGIIITTDRDGIIRFVNRTVPGLDPRKVVGTSFWDYVDPDHRDMIQQHVDRVYATGQPTEYEVPPKHDVYQGWFSVRLGPLVHGDEIVGLVFVMADVSDKVQLLERVHLADRLATVGQMAAGVGHEVNNPLTYVLANLERLNSKLPADSELHPLVAQALEGAERIRHVTRDLSELSQRREAPVTKVNVHSVLESTLRMTDNEIRFRARLHKEFTEVPLVLANESRLGQVFLNLLLNAVQSIPVGQVDENQICVRTSTTEDGWARVEISDTGEGIPDSLLKRIFEPFVTTKAEGLGTGLGLYICHNVVNALGGKLLAHSSHGKGSRFEVLLPPAPSRPIQTPRVATSKSSRDLKVLVIDDEPTIVEVLVAALRDHAVVTASSGTEGITALDEAGPFDLIFCDLIMPQQTGIDVYRHLLKTQPDKTGSIIFMTGGAFTADTREFIESSDVRCLDKPFSFDDFEGIVAEFAAAKQAAD